MRRRIDRRGMAMPLVLTAVVVIFLVAGSVAALSIQNARMATGLSQRATAHELVQAGLAEARNRLDGTPNWTVDVLTKTRSSVDPDARAYYDVKPVTLARDAVTVDVTGYVEDTDGRRLSAMTIRATFRRAGTPFRYPVQVGGTVSLSGGSRVEAPEGLVAVRTNAVVQRTIDLLGSTISGDVVVGPTDSLVGVVSKDIPSEVGLVTSSNTPASMPPVEDPTTKLPNLPTRGDVSREPVPKPEPAPVVYAPAEPPTTVVTTTRRKSGGFFSILFKFVGNVFKAAGGYFGTVLTGGSSSTAGDQFDQDVDTAFDTFVSDLNDFAANGYRRKTTTTTTTTVIPGKAGSPVPQPVPQPGPSVSNPGNIDLAEARYGSLKITDGSTVTLGGGNYVFGDVTLTNRSTLRRNPDAKERTVVYLTGDMSVDDAALQNAGSAGDLVILGTKPGATYSLKDLKEAFKGALYAPDASIQMSNSDLLGALVSGSLNAEAESSVKYDDTLRPASVDGVGTATMVSWELR